MQRQIISLLNNIQTMNVMCYSLFFEGKHSSTEQQSNEYNIFGGFALMTKIKPNIFPSFYTRPIKYIIIL